MVKGLPGTPLISRDENDEQKAHQITLTQRTRSRALSAASRLIPSLQSNWNGHKTLTRFMSPKWPKSGSSWSLAWAWAATVPISSFALGWVGEGTERTSIQLSKSNVMIPLPLPGAIHKRRVEHRLAPLPSIRRGCVNIQIPKKTDPQWLLGMLDACSRYHVRRKPHLLIPSCIGITFQF